MPAVDTILNVSELSFKSPADTAELAGRETATTWNTWQGAPIRKIKGRQQFAVNLYLLVRLQRIILFEKVPFLNIDLPFLWEAI